jgi:hypothetical protein
MFTACWQSFFPKSNKQSNFVHTESNESCNHVHIPPCKTSIFLVVVPKFALYSNNFLLSTENQLESTSMTHTKMGQYFDLSCFLWS